LGGFPAQKARQGPQPPAELRRSGHRVIEGNGFWGNANANGLNIDTDRRFSGDDPPYGIFFMPLGFVLADVRTGMARYGGADWNFRESTLKQCLERSGLTLSFWTFVGLVRRCFPMLAMRKMGVVESVTALIAETCRNAPSHNGGAVGQLEIKLLAELKDWQNDKLLASILSFNELYSRCTLLGLMPEDNELKNNLNNTYNNTHVREARIGSLSQK